MQLLKLRLTGLKNYLRTSKVQGFFGMNASGKTTVARAIKLFYEFTKPKNVTSIINTDEYKRILNKSFMLESIYYCGDMINISTLESNNAEIIKDVLYSTKISNINNKSCLVDIFENYAISDIDNVNIKDKEQVKQDVSVEYMDFFNQVSLIALSNNSKADQLIDTLDLTNFNYFYMSESDETLINDIIVSLDKNVEKIKIIEKQMKFK